MQRSQAQKEEIALQKTRDSWIDKQLKNINSVVCIHSMNHI